MLRGGPVAKDLKLGRPDNRSRRYAGDRRGLVDEDVLWGPDAHGVYWRPVRSYFDADARAGAGETLVIMAPVHPDELGAAR
ncbi:hypothetical protein [Mycobacterium sp. CnD-18-1]|uniref:hypothetical protein n=1 Tax=Mycobacterium sp. CnD-18-1 TaxID=2917744 RepID=UPI001EF23A58|nr:hypothetical protein [Mycobacterium sp. CnD-18-1]MCG7610333.1 hypothetical protein [Mycobacterium sp. CnD-18-1]